MSTILEAPLPDCFRTTVLRGLPEGATVDAKSLTITGAKAMEVGPLNAGDARPWKVDQTTLGQLVSLVNDTSRKGVKMRFAHPNMSRDGMGRHLGRATNARMNAEGTAVLVDAKIAETARKSPQGNLADYVIDLATETPEDFGLSIAPLLDSEAMGKIEPDENGLVPIRLKALRAIDFVDEPAATRGGLFHVEGSDSLADLPGQATWLLDTFFADAPANVIRERFGEFLDTYFRSKGLPIMSNVETKSSPEVVVEDQPNLSQANAAAELTRRSQIAALCKLAKVSEADRQLMIDAGFSVEQAQNWLKSSGHLSVANPPVGEGAEQKPTTPQEKFGAEYDEQSAALQKIGVTREAYIKSRMIG